MLDKLRLGQEYEFIYGIHSKRHHTVARLKEIYQNGNTVFLHFEEWTSEEYENRIWINLNHIVFIKELEPFRKYDFDKQKYYVRPNCIRTSEEWIEEKKEIIL